MDLKKLIRTNYSQIFFVCAAFFMMVVIGGFSVSNVIRKESLAAVTLALNETEKTMRSYLREPKIAFDSIYTAVQDSLDKGESQDAVRQYLERTAYSLIMQTEGVMGFNNVYGYIRGEFISGRKSAFSSDYVPQQQPWYQLALRGSEAEYTAPYLHSDDKRMMISMAQEIYGKRGDYYGILSMDIEISWLMEYVETLQFVEGGYGMIINQYLYTIAHPHEQYRNIPLQSLGGGYSEISNILRSGQNVSAKTIEDVDGSRVIVFFSRLYNGWYIGVIMPLTSFYSDWFMSILILAVLGVVLSVILSVILLRVSAAKLQSEEESRMKTSFLARMSHEIRTPMNAIIGMAELAMREEIPLSAYEHVLSIKQSGANLLSIINDILDFSKIESGKLEIVTEPYQASSLFNDVINIIQTRVMDSHLRFVTNINSNIPREMLGDEIRIRQILLNLLSNAAKYTDEGFISLAVSGEITGSDTVMLTMTVADSGRGIKQEDIERLFDDFVQLNIIKNKGIEGTGLGLAITRSLVREMGGEISAQSEYGKGSVFTVKLPQRFRWYERLASLDNPDDIHVLVYERRNTYGDSVKQIIHDLGAKCTLVTDEQEFYTALENSDCNYVFVSSFLIKNAQRVATQIGANKKLVLMTEYGETVAERSLTILTMPVGPVGIANILSGVSDSTGMVYRDRKDLDTRFIAPSAKVLVVDDVYTNLKVAEGLMVPYKMQIDICKNGMEAIDAVRKSHYDLILLDHMMPEMDGIETAKRIRALEDDIGKRTVIIALTANAISGAKEMFLQNGFDDFLPKPVDTYQLNNILERWIPKDKQKKYIEERDEQLPASIAIKGLDTDKGIAMTGGTKEHYLKTLASFYADGVQKIEEMRHSLEADDLSMYIICVHSLKSVLGSIGATELSETAKALEAAGNKKDLVYIDECNDRFIRKLEALLENIQLTLPSHSVEDSDEPVDQELINAGLIQLKTALEALDLAVIDSAAESLQDYTTTPESGLVIEAILRNTLIGDYDEAISLIDELLS